MLRSQLSNLICGSNTLCSRAERQPDLQADFDELCDSACSDKMRRLTKSLVYFWTTKVE